jgi:hypothetical protein
MSRPNPDQWQALSPYLDQALTLTGEERSIWLSSLRAQNPGLAEQLEGLLEDQYRPRLFEPRARSAGPG